MPLENYDLCERMGLILFRNSLSRCSFLPRCLPLCPRPFVRALPLSWRTSPATPNRRAAALRREARQVDPGGPPRVWAWLSHIWSDWRSALASLLGMEDSAGPAGKTHACPRSPRPDPQDVPRESHLGCAAHPRRVAQTRHRHRGDQRKQIHGVQP